MDPKFKPGDKVRLTSGSATIVVRSEVDGFVSCDWYDFNKKEFQHSTFLREQLELVASD